MSTRKLPAQPRLRPDLTTAERIERVDELHSVIGLLEQRARRYNGLPYRRKRLPVLSAEHVESTRARAEESSPSQLVQRIEQIEKGIDEERAAIVIYVAALREKQAAETDRLSREVGRRKKAKAAKRTSPQRKRGES